MIKLVPLNSDFDEWGNMIVFNSNPNDLMPVGKELCVKAKLFN